VTTLTDGAEKPCTSASIEQRPAGTFTKRNAPRSSDTSVLVVASAAHARVTRTPSPKNVLPSAAVSVTVPMTVALGLAPAPMEAAANTVNNAAATTSYVGIKTHLTFNGTRRG